MALMWHKKKIKDNTKPHMWRRRSRVDDEANHTGSVDVDMAGDGDAQAEARSSSCFTYIWVPCGYLFIFAYCATLSKTTFNIVS
uniref:Uncharacterized protein n=1 Tax=Oryza sativa subsp. japonica TaxID=39947 RepID=Q6ZJ13_ORYSJ|nr:hypothetical protein [Oryza sativa Japonica Group]